MYELLLTLFKMLSDVLTAGFGVLGLLTEFKTKSGKITKTGRIALSGIGASLIVSIGVTGLETKKDQDSARQHAQELIDQSLPISDSIEGRLLISTKFITYNFANNSAAFDRIPYVLGIRFYRRKDSCEVLDKEIGRAELHFTNSVNPVYADWRDLAKLVRPENVLDLRPQLGASVQLNQSISATLIDRNGLVRSANDLVGTTILIVSTEPPESSDRIVAFRLRMSPGIEIRGGDWSTTHQPLVEYHHITASGLPLIERGYCYTFAKDDIVY